MNVESFSHTLFTRSCGLEFSGSKMSRVELMTTLRVSITHSTRTSGRWHCSYLLLFANHVVFFYAIHYISTWIGLWRGRGEGIKISEQLLRVHSCLKGHRTLDRSNFSFDGKRQFFHICFDIIKIKEKHDVWKWKEPSWKQDLEYCLRY